MTKLIVLPDARPIIKNTFEIVAVRHRRDLKTPTTQRTAMPAYNPIVALKVCVKSIVSTLKSKNFGRMRFGDNP